MKKSGYANWQGSVQVVAGEEIHVSGNLNKDRNNEQPHKQRYDQTLIEPITGLEFILVEGGCYSMGEKRIYGYSKLEFHIHRVCVDAFYLAKYEMNQKTWADITGENPSRRSPKSMFGEINPSEYPVENVSWEEVQKFINKLNSKTGLSFRLPTEAEWEYAARSGGKNELFSGGKNYGDRAWGGGKDYKAQEPQSRQVSYYSNKETHKINTKKPNGLGHFLMSGNVAEWCSDWFGEDYYKISPKENPTGPEIGSEKIVRGGSWLSFPSQLITFVRSHAEPNTKNDQIGFRLALPVD